MVFKAMMDPAHLGAGAAIVVATLVAAKAGSAFALHIRARRKAQGIVDEHLETLARRKLVLCKTDPYGVEDRTGWEEEIIHFVEKVMRPALTRAEMAALLARGFPALAAEFVEEPASRLAAELESLAELPEDPRPEEYEAWCALTLSRFGWATRTSGQPGDQGADVLAEKDGVRLVLQCKLYAKPVGNKAVQEAFSARRHYLVERAAVVTNAGFTASARELARSTGVLLLHSTDLPQLDTLLGLGPAC